MKLEGGIFAFGTVIFAVLAAVYWVMAREPVGTTVLVLTAGLCFLIAFYVLFTGRRIGMRPEDDLSGEVADGAGEYGFFSPHSWWPLPVAFSMAMIGTGIIVGWWLVVLGVIALFISLIGFVFEYYRGEHVDV